MKSLRARLLLSVSVATLLVWAVAGVVSYDKARHEADELLDGQLSQSAKLLLAQVRHEEGDQEDAGDLTESLEEGERHPYEQTLAFQVWRADGRLLLRSEQAPRSTMAAATGYIDLSHDGQTWRQLSTWSADRRYQVQVAQPVQDRERVALEVAAQVAVPVLGALPLLMLFLYFAVAAGLRPLQAVASGVAARSPSNLEALEDARAPAEVRPLIDALNTLLARLGATLENERRFTADAAHELRTPLAALKIQAEVARASEPGADQRHALNQVVTGVDRATRLVEQLLRLARLDPLQGLAGAQPTALHSLLEEVAGEASERARARGQSVGIHLPDAPIAVLGDADMLRVALRNLLENALRYTPAGGEIEVGAGRMHGAPRLWVADNGPGVAQEELARLSERFYRGSEVTAEGSGLGLAIVQRIAELHGARLVLANRAAGGFEAALAWNAPQ
ncbi:MAG: sensor histidine kinase N-terminal domain-containing protein [Betaproteobacteria bacterium]|nr:sensor histidine kinase N-terminal domain-containing protein [Betaproteobacteria bacterium]